MRPRLPDLFNPRYLPAAVPEAFSMLVRRRARRRDGTPIEVDRITIDPLAVAAASSPAAPGALWVADLTLLDTADGPLYLVAVLDGHSRRCLGWSASARLHPRLVIEAVERAASLRWPAIGVRFDPRIMDREIPLALGPACGLAAVAVPSEPAARALDLAVAASFFSMMRRDLLDAHSWPSRADASRAIDRWISDYYNPGLAPGTPWAGAIADELDELSR